MQKTLEKHNKKWFIIFGVWLVYYSFGFTISSIPPLVPYITNDLNITYKKMGLILGAWQFIYIFSALPSGLFIDKYGLKISILISSLIIALSLIFRGLADNFIYMWISVALFGIGGPLISVSAPKASTLWNNKKNRSISMGILVTGPFIGGITSLSITNSIIMPLLNYKWQNVFFIYSLIPLIAAIIWVILYRYFGENKNLEHKNDKIKNPINLKILVNKKRYILILILGIITMFLVHGVSNWLPEILSAKGLEIKYASHLATIPIIIGIMSALIIPRICDNNNRIKVLFILFIIAIIAINLIKFSNQSIYILGLLFLGITTGSLLSLLFNHIAETKDISYENMGFAGGLFFSITEIGGVLGPFSIGFIYDYTQNFNTALSFYTAILLLTFFPLYLIRKLK